MTADLTVEVLRERIGQTWERIRRAGGDESRVTLVGVTKTFGPEVVALALDVGLLDLGENYGQELEVKAPAAALHAESTGVEPPRWHFIGGLQRNKIKRLASVVTLWQTVDRAVLVDEIAKRAPGARILIQVNTTDEDQKSGCNPLEAGGLVERAVAAGLTVEGLMTVGPTDGGDPTAAFRGLRSLADDLGLATCSMGMSADLETAVAEGSTMVRVGSALFGARFPSRVV